MNRLISNLLGGASGLLVLIPAQPIPQVTPVTAGRSDADAMRADAVKIGADFRYAIRNTMNGKVIKAQA